MFYHLKHILWQSMHDWRSFRTSKFTPKVSGLNFLSPQICQNPIARKIKWNLKIYLLRIINNNLLSHLKNILWQYMNNWRNFRTSKFTLMLKFFYVNKHTKIQFLKKIKWNSKMYPLRIMKTLLLYHLKQTSCQSMHIWWSFMTSMESHARGPVLWVAAASGWTS